MADHEKTLKRLRREHGQAAWSSNVPFEEEDPPFVGLRADYSYDDDPDDCEVTLTVLAEDGKTPVTVQIPVPKLARWCTNVLSALRGDQHNYRQRSEAATET